MACSSQFYIQTKELFRTLEPHREMQEEAVVSSRKRDKTEQAGRGSAGLGHAFGLWNTELCLVAQYLAMGWTGQMDHGQNVSLPERKLACIWKVCSWTISLPCLENG